MTSLTPTLDFEQDCNDAVSGLRVKLIALYDRLGLEPTMPQNVARQLGINKTLTWNIARFLQAPSGLEAASYVPGPTSMERMLRSCAKHGPCEPEVEGARAAAKLFHQMVETHIGDRADLELMLDSLGGPGTDGLALSRRLAFRGLSGVYGVQARTRLQCWLLAPNADDPAQLDLANVSGYVGFRRLRPAVRWPLFRPRFWDKKDSPLMVNHWEPIVPEQESENGAPIMAEFTHGGAAKIVKILAADGDSYVLQPGSVGNNGAFDCYQGEVLRSAASRYRSETDEIGELGASITTPTQHLVLDAIFHRDLDEVMSSHPLVFGRTHMQGEPTGSEDDAFLLPISHRIAHLPGSPPAVATSLVPRYATMLRSVSDRLGWNLDEFCGIRFHLEYPPLGSQVMLRFTLPDRENA